MSLACGYCQLPAQKVTGAVIYPHRPDLKHKVIYACFPCDAYVGCHPGTDRPLGLLANAELRAARQAAHAAFDPIWRGTAVSRTKAYAWLAQALQLETRRCHIGMFDIALCQRVVELCKLGYPNMPPQDAP